MNWATAAPALDVPQCHFRGADCGESDTAAPKIESSVHHSLPERLDLERILPDQEIAQSPADRVGERSVEHRLEDSRNRVALADALDPLIGQNADYESVLRPVADLPSIG